MHLQTTLSLALLASTTPVLANDIVSLFLPAVDPQPVVGEIIGVKDQVTSYVLYCAKGTPSESCGLPEDGYTMAQGPSTWRYQYTFEDYHESQGCKIGDKSSVTCVVSASQSDRVEKQSTVLVTDSMPYLPVTITATASGVGATTKGSPAQETATATPTGKDGAKATTTAATTKTSGGETAATDGASAAAASTSSDNAAVGAMVTGSAMQWVAGGAAMGVAWALV
ncbi:hypothetical protein FE257_007813 [Aspergillus nanangensis]|uniref:Uncharacterized protein n=1 Tax=Aspergillus nanangensis TaxID=2582783 RepID=A0AAD4GZ23_ASPNN|nr:hypothetical protein FE257_007813 [Aspergillus nanangensis]